MVAIEPVEEDKLAFNTTDEKTDNQSTASTIRPGVGGATSMGNDIFERFETTSEGNDGTGRDGVSCDSQEEHHKEGEGKEQPVPENNDCFEDALDDEQLEQQALALANDAKVEGNSLFKDGRYEDALLKYGLALQVAPEVSSSVELRSMCHANRSICYLKQGEYEETIKECTKALELNPTYMKVLFRRGEAYEKLERYEDAIAVDHS